MTLEQKTPDDRASLLNLLLEFDRSTANCRNEIRGLLAQYPSLEFNFRSLLPVQVRHEPVTPTSTRRPAELCVQSSTFDCQLEPAIFGFGHAPSQRPDIQNQTTWIRSTTYESEDLPVSLENVQFLHPFQRNEGSVIRSENISTKQTSGASADPNGGSWRRYQKARAVATAAVHELGSPKILNNIRIDLAVLRNKIEVPCRPLDSNPELAEQDIVAYIKTIQWHFREISTDTQFASAKARFRRSLIANIYYQYKNIQGHRVGSLGVLFAKTMLPSHRTKDCSDSSLRGKWKAEMLKNKFWYHLVEQFGCGILSVISDQLNDEHVRRLSPNDVAKFTSDIHNKCLNLRQDLVGLSDLLQGLFIYGVLPKRKIFLENMNVDDMLPTSCEHIRQFFTFCDNSSSPPLDDTARDVNERHECLQHEPMQGHCAEMDDAVSTDITGMGDSYKEDPTILPSAGEHVINVNSAHGETTAFFEPLGPEPLEDSLSKEGLLMQQHPALRTSTIPAACWYKEDCIDPSALSAQ